MPTKRTRNPSRNKQKKSTVQHRVEQFSGPVPHPDILKKYDEIMPGLAERLVSMAEDSMRAEVKLKSKAVDVRELEITSRDRQEKQEHTDYRLGVLVELLVVLLFLGVAVYAISEGAYYLATAVITALAGIIWSVRRSNKTN